MPGQSEPDQRGFSVRGSLCDPRADDHALKPTKSGNHASGVSSAPPSTVALAARLRTTPCANEKWEMVHPERFERPALRFVV